VHILQKWQCKILHPFLLLFTVFHLLSSFSIKFINWRSCVYLRTFNKQYWRVCYSFIYYFNIDNQKNQGIMNKPSISPCNHQSERVKCLLVVYVEVINMSITHPSVLLLTYFICLHIILQWTLYYCIHGMATFFRCHIMGATIKKIKHLP